MPVSCSATACCTRSLNYSSALLILGAPNPPSTQVARAALLGVPRGVPLGIPGAPDLLPAPQDLLPAPWTVCSRRPDRPAPGSFMAESVLLIGAGAARDRAVGRAWVAGPGRQRSAAPAVERPPLPGHRRAPAAAGVRLVAAGGPAGRHGRAQRGAGRRRDRTRDRSSGAPGRVRSPATGSVRCSWCRPPAGRRTFGVAQSDGLADITQVQADLLLADGANGPGGRASEMGQALYASSPHAAVAGPDAAPPRHPRSHRTWRASTVPRVSARPTGTGPRRPIWCSRPHPGPAPRSGRPPCRAT